MNTTTKHLNRHPYLTPVAYLCILLTMLTSHETVWARVANAPVTIEVKSSEPALPVEPAVAEGGIKLLVLHSLYLNSQELLFKQGATNFCGYISGVSLEGDRTLRFKIQDTLHTAEAQETIRNLDPTVSTRIDGDSLVMSFDQSIANQISGALEQGTLDLSKLGGKVQNLIGYCIVLIGLGVGTYYGLKYLCKKAGLIPPTVPPPPPTNPPPPPPPTNRPPTWTNTNGGPITITGIGGFKMFNLVTESSVMPSNVFRAWMSGTSPSKPLFQVESDNPFDETLHGVAVIDATDFNTLYGGGYSDPTGVPYERCMRHVIQASPTLTGTNWQTRMTMYVWLNDNYACFSVYDAAGVNRENVVLQKSAIYNGVRIDIKSFEHVLTHWYNPNAEGYFRTWSGVAPTVP